MRAQLKWFAGRMERELRNNDHKGGWLGDSVEALLHRAKEELEELEDATRASAFEVSADDAICEAADVANFIMMIADKLRRDAGGKIKKGA